MPRRPSRQNPSPWEADPASRVSQAGTNAAREAERAWGAKGVAAEVLAAAEDARLVALLEEARGVTDRLIAPIREEDWGRTHNPVLGPVAWDVVHIGQQEDFWLAQILGGLPELKPGENRIYDPMGNPRTVRQGLPLLSKEQASRFRDRVRSRTLQVLRHQRRDPSDPHWRDLFLHKMIVQHEAMHDETILQHISAYPLDHYEPSSRRAKRRDRVPALELTGFARHPQGVFPMGARWRSPWTFDNEWPMHAVHVDPFWLARAPVTNGMYLRFLEAGGYKQGRWWHPDGWEWVTRQGIEAPLYWHRDGDQWTRREVDRWVPLDPAEPVVHVSWFEADACARFFGCRLPTEEEWEYAALWDPDAGRKRVWPWGDREPEPRHGNLDHDAWGPEPVGSHPDGASVHGVHGLVGDAWEWTDSCFAPYPGFEAFPYRGYSQVFFTPEYRVLRGGSWATRSSLRLGTLRNWDFPVRRQIFSTLRLAADSPPGWADPETGAVVDEQAVGDH